MDILVRPQLADCVDNESHWGKSLRVKVDKSHHVFDTGIHPRLKCTVPRVVEEISDTLRRVNANVSTIFLGDFNAYVGNETMQHILFADDLESLASSEQGLYCNMH